MKALFEVYRLTRLHSILFSWTPVGVWKTGRSSEWTRRSMGVLIERMSRSSRLVNKSAPNKIIWRRARALKLSSEYFYSSPPRPKWLLSLIDTPLKTPPAPPFHFSFPDISVTPPPLLHPHPACASSLRRRQACARASAWRRGNDAVAANDKRWRGWEGERGKAWEASRGRSRRSREEGWDESGARCEGIDRSSVGCTSKKEKNLRENRTSRSPNAAALHLCPKWCNGPSIMNVWTLYV